jgi:hypothetical protein
MVQMMMLWFNNGCVEILLHILGCSICDEHCILARFFPNAVVIKASTIICTKAAQKMLMKLSC